MKATPALTEGLAALVRGDSLDAESATRIFEEIMAGCCDPTQIAGFLVGLSVRGESTEVIAGAARAMRAAATTVETSRRPLVDTCGTGGSGVSRLNVSTAVAIAVAACGVAVAKHGNRAASSRSGSADVLEALGVDVFASPKSVGHCIDDVGVGFLFARTLHPAMKHAALVRRSLGIRTIFNLLGPLTNPASATRQVMGVYDPARVQTLAQTLGVLGSERVFVVHGFRRGAEVDAGPLPAPGIDDLSPEGPSLCWEFRDGGLRRHILTPSDAGLDEDTIESLAGGDPHANARALRAVLEGAPGPYRRAVQYAGALTLVVAGDEDLSSMPEKAQDIGQALDDGRAARVLERLCEWSTP